MTTEKQQTAEESRQSQYLWQTNLHGVEVLQSDVPELRGRVQQEELEAS